MVRLPPLLQRRAASGRFGRSWLVCHRSTFCLAGARATPTSCCLLPPVLLFGRVHFEWRDLLPIGLLGITQFGILIALLNYALQFIPSARAALIFATMPLLTMMLATVLGHERLTLAKTAGVLLTILGVGFALGEKALQRGGTAHEWVGELAVFASALSGAICSVLYRPYLRKYPTLPVSALPCSPRSGSSGACRCGRIFGSLPHFTAGLAGRRFHWGQQRHRLLSLAVGFESHHPTRSPCSWRSVHHSGRIGAFLLGETFQCYYSWGSFALSLAYGSHTGKDMVSTS
jgi:hypothetical protein